MLADYVPILVLIALVLGFAVVNLVLSDLLARKRKGVSKHGAYECGMRVEGDARLRLSIHFYMVAVTFILFDVEAIFLIPWAVSAKAFAAAGAGMALFGLVGLFIAILAIGLVYEWRIGGLDWDR